MFARCFRSSVHPRLTLVALFAGLVAALPALAADQTVPGQGNADAVRLADRSPLVRSAHQFLIEQAYKIRQPAVRRETLDILTNPRTCVRHRVGLASDAAKDAVVAQLVDAGLVKVDDAATFPGGLRAAIFPPVLNESSSCPQLPQPFRSAPGSAYGGHHSYPGGLPVHEANNGVSDVHLAEQYQSVYGFTAFRGLPQVDPDAAGQHWHPNTGDLAIDGDTIVAAPIWHDWAKTIVFQWNADGSEFAEFNFGGNGATDAWGAGGDSRTGGHHVLSIAEAMARGLPPLLVIAQASAHSAPTYGNEYKVVNWLRAAAIIARVDAVAAGYLAPDGEGRLRLPPIGRLGDVDLNAAGQTNLRAEYVLHNLSDADYTYSGPVVSTVAVVLAQLAPEFGYAAAETTRYNTAFRNPALAYLSAERLGIVYGERGLDGVRRELKRLRQLGVI
ncbi:hypothetical protein [Dokdonella sp.]|uniref:hypothetical protein n=1 Tax=Dokdonella sp. TaxID=2291710 RepID=UPI001B0BE041|nr:hypothetical protein [Dokdonella sp.]MBO9663506.1 hypothetical protein [Dokdonella sp.]